MFLSQVVGTVPTMSINKTEGCQVYLSKESLNCDIVSAKSSEMNIMIPTDDDDYVSAWGTTQGRLVLITVRVCVNSQPLFFNRGSFQSQNSSRPFGMVPNWWQNQLKLQVELDPHHHHLTSINHHCLVNQQGVHSTVYMFNTCELKGIKGIGCNKNLQP